MQQGILSTNKGQLALAVVAVPVIALSACGYAMPEVTGTVGQDTRGAATGLNSAAVFVGFLLKPGSYGIDGVSIGWSFGAFLTLIAAIAAVGVLTPPCRGRLNSRSQAVGQ